MERHVQKVLYWIQHLTVPVCTLSSFKNDISYESSHSFTNIKTKFIVECDWNMLLLLLCPLDEDECAVDSPCSHSCNNIMGGFSCACPSGFTISTESNTCQGQIYINHKFSNLSKDFE